MWTAWTFAKLFFADTTVILQKISNTKIARCTVITSETAVECDVGQGEMVADEKHTRCKNLVQLGQGRRGHRLLSELPYTVLQPMVHLQESCDGHTTVT